MVTATKPKRPRPAPKPAGKSPAQRLLTFARAKAASCRTWTELYNAVYGVGALFGQLFPTQAERMAFAKSAEYRELTKLIDDLSGPDDELPSAATSSGKLLVRLPSSLHSALLKEAELEGVSVNQLVVAKLSAQLRDMTFRSQIADSGKRHRN